jgi:hypothetical protein
MLSSFSPAVSYGPKWMLVVVGHRRRVLDRSGHEDDGRSRLGLVRISPWSWPRLLTPEYDEACDDAIFPVTIQSAGEIIDDSVITSLRGPCPRE